MLAAYCSFLTFSMTSANLKNSIKTSKQKNASQLSAVFVRQFFTALIFIFLFCLPNFGQNAPASPCPEVSIKLDRGGHILANESLDIVVDIFNYDLFSLKYIWKLTYKDKVLFSGESDYKIPFTTTEEMDGSALTATVEIKGLPINCKTIYLASIPISLGGDPAVIGHYKNSTFAKEKIELDDIAAYYKNYSKEYKDAILVFVSYRKGNKYNNRIREISDYLLQKHKIPNKKLTFFFGGTTSNEIMVYILPKDIYAKDRK